MYPDAEIAKQFPSYVKTLAARLAAADKRAYPVGGCVRDLLRGVTPNDFDMTTNATPEEIMAILFDLRVVPTGIAHGTVTVIVEEHAVELTTHRTDGTYHDSRHPDSVTFTDDLTEDLARRDFTVNAMAFDLEANTVIDPFGGKWDLENGIIRAVGDPTARFLEDALRILRAFRFAAKLDDVLNFIPSRLTAIAMIISAYILGFNGRNAFKIWKRDRRKHASPNSAQTESVCAGALEIRLAGDAYYFGELHKKDYIGDDNRPVENEDIKRANKLMYCTTIIVLIISLIFRAFVFGGVL